MEEPTHKKRYESIAKVGAVVKELYKPIILNHIGRLNVLFEQNKEYKHLKVIIAGGEAFNYYVDPGVDVQAFQTHDYDLRFYWDEPPSKNPIFNNHMDDYMISIGTEFMQGLAYAMNEQTTQELLNQLLLVDITLESTNSIIFTAVGPDSGPLRVITYTFHYYDSNGNKVTGSDGIVDLFPYLPNYATHYGIRQLTEEAALEIKNSSDAYGVYSRNGFFKNQIYYMSEDLSTEGYPRKLYYVALGFLFWDTVRMINWTIDTMLQKPNYGNFKLMRYINKYYALLDVLNTPGDRIKCNSEFVRQILDRCAVRHTATKPQLCNYKKADGQIVALNGSRVIQSLVAAGIVPSSPEWVAFLEKMSDEDLCGVLQETSINIII